MMKEVYVTIVVHILAAIQTGNLVQQEIGKNTEKLSTKLKATKMKKTKI